MKTCIYICDVYCPFSTTDKLVNLLIRTATLTSDQGFRDRSTGHPQGGRGSRLTGLGVGEQQGMAAIHLLPPPTSDRPEAVVFALWVPTTPKPDGNRHGRLAQAGEPLAPDRAQGWGRGMGGRPPPLGQLGTVGTGLGQMQGAAAHPHAALTHVRPTCRGEPRANDQSETCRSPALPSYSCSRSRRSRSRRCSSGSTALWTLTRTE